MRQVRAFLAIPLPAPLRERIARLQGRLSGGLPGVRWTRPETIHLTLKFFGDLPEESLDRIGEVVLSIGHLCAPFRAEATGVGAFPSLQRPRVVWLGVEGAPPLARLHADLEDALEGIGLPRDDRPFTPHLTLGRCRKPLRHAENALEPFRDARCGAFTVESLVLYESRLQPGGTMHLPRTTIALGR